LPAATQVELLRDKKRLKKCFLSLNTPFEKIQINFKGKNEFVKLVSALHPP
jgi:hypothetical protein